MCTCGYISSIFSSPCSIRINGHVPLFCSNNCTTSNSCKPCIQCIDDCLTVSIIILSTHQHKYYDELLSLQYIVKLVSGQYSQYWEVMISLVKTIKKSINHSTRPEHGGWINWLSIPQIRKYNYRDIFNHYIKNYKCLIRPNYHYRRHWLRPINKVQHPILYSTLYGNFPIKMYLVAFNLAIWCTHALLCVCTLMIDGFNICKFDLKSPITK